MKKNLLAFFLTLGLAFSAFVAQAETVKVAIQTSEGDMVLELYPDKAPKTVENFLKYVDDGFYANTVFHRVIKGFMIQGGGLTADMKKKETREAIKNEAQNGLKNVYGSIAMARTSSPHTATAQFFINHKKNKFLDFPGSDGWGYCVFGQIVEGDDVIEKIANVKTTRKNGRGDVPAEPITITAITRIGQ